MEAEPEEKDVPTRIKSHSLSLHRSKSRASSRKSRRDKERENIVREIYPETDLEKGLVGWESQDDPLHPRNFPEARKWASLGFVSGITLLR